jgi:formylglycine-generating enzyme required for sulfatase activity
MKNTPALPHIGTNRIHDNFPVVGLTFNEKRAYCQAQGGDLPTAAQLHYASRFDQKTRYRDLIIADDGFRLPGFVTEGYKNIFGVYNLLANVWESALDAYDPNFYARMASQDPYNPMTTADTRLEELTGGSFLDSRLSARPADRSHVNRENLLLIGFRCALPLPQNSKK